VVSRGQQDTDRWEKAMSYKPQMHGLIVALVDRTRAVANRSGFKAKRELRKKTDDCGSHRLPLAGQNLME